MLLRASTNDTDTDVQWQAIVDNDVNSGIACGDALSAFAEALVRRSPDLDAARDRLAAEVGTDALIEAAGTAANFQRMTRIADAIGIPLDQDGGEKGVAFRERMGIAAFAGAANTPVPSG